MAKNKPAEEATTEPTADAPVVLVETPVVALPRRYEVEIHLCLLGKQVVTIEPEFVGDDKAEALARYMAYGGITRSAQPHTVTRLPDELPDGPASEA
jgi:hypothetical protein